MTIHKGMVTSSYTSLNTNAHFQGVRDPRIHRKCQQVLSDFLVVAVCLE